MSEHDETPAAIDGEEAANPEAAEATDLVAIRELVLRAHPDVVPELIAGESVEALLASVGPAQAAFQRLAERFPQRPTPPSGPSVPAGGDRPAPVDPERLPASEKIRRGLAGRRP